MSGKEPASREFSGYVSRVYPIGPRPMNPEWVLSSKEAQKLEMNMYPQGKVISIFQKKNVEFQVVKVLNYILHRLKKKKMKQTKT